MPNEKLNVYILRPAYLKKETAGIENAVSLVQSVEGPIAFKYVEYPEHDPRKKLKRTDASFDPFKKLKFLSLNEISMSMLEHKFVPEDQMEGMKALRHRVAAAADWCLDKFREKREDTLVILLSRYQNEWNYFASILPENPNAAFIQCNHFIVSNMNAPHIPLAYEFLALALRFRAFNVPDFYHRFAHQDTIGCMNDFFAYVPDMERKVKTADICTACKLRIREMNVSRDFVRQVRDGFEQVRRLQLNFESYLEVSEYPTLHVERTNIRVSDLGMDIRLSPKEMTVYKFFFDHPEGIAFNQLYLHKESLLRTYRQLMNYGRDNWRDVAVRVVETLVDVTQNSLSETVSRLNRKIASQLGREFGTYGQIVNDSRGIRTIDLSGGKEETEKPGFIREVG